MPPFDKKLPRCIGEPTYQHYIEARNFLYHNLRQITSPFGGSQHSHLGLIMPTAKYFNIASNAWQVPPIQPAVPVIPPGATPRPTLHYLQPVEYHRERDHVRQPRHSPRPQPNHHRLDRIILHRPLQCRLRVRSHTPEGDIKAHSGKLRQVRRQRDRINAPSNL